MTTGLGVTSMVIVFVVGLSMMMPQFALKMFEKIPLPKFMHRT